MEHTALLLMDYQNDMLKSQGAKAEHLLANAKQLLTAARNGGALVVFVRVAFRTGYPEVSPQNKMFASMRTANRLVLGTSGAEIHDMVKPLELEPVVTKKRVGAFAETDLATILRAQEINHLVLAGLSTSGVVLSTLRAAADQDFRLTVVEDACADTDEEIHRVLMTKIFLKQADVISTQDALQTFAT